MPEKNSKPLLPTNLDIAVAALSLLMILFHVVIAVFPLGDQLLNQNVHLGFALVLIFVHRAQITTAGLLQKQFVCVALLALLLIIHVAFHQQRLVMAAGFPEPVDVLVGILLIAIVIHGTWLSFGAAIPVLTLVAMAYTVWGHVLPGDAGHPSLPVGYIVSSMSVGFQGIYGIVLNVSVTIIFLLVVFGALFEVTGITPAFMEIGVFSGRKISGGSGQSAIVASTLTGMLNGVAAANVAITGFNTIPAMEAGGFKKETACAIEAVASTGSQLTPPVMGIVVFIMAGFLGVGYAEIMAMALVPAAAFYGVVVLGVIIIAGREHIPLGTARECPRTIVEGLFVFAVPSGVVAFLLFRHYSVSYAAVWGIVFLLAAAGAQKATRPNLSSLVSCLHRGAVLGATFGAACACIGMLFKCLTLTGAPTKIGLAVGAATGGTLWLPLALTMLLCLLLGTCLPTVAAYTIVAITAVPLLADHGLSRPVAHFFAFYFGVMANVIPPVSGPSLVASRICGADYMATALETFRLALPFFPLPFFLIRNPVLLLEPQPLPAAAAAVCALVLAMVALACCCQRQGLVPNAGVEPLILPVASLLATGYGLTGNPLLFYGSLALFGIYAAAQWKRYAKRGSPLGSPVRKVKNEPSLN